MKPGFTLIELMIVVAIIGILSMIALPAYQDYTKRTYVTEGIALSSGVKLAVTETFSSSGKWPFNNAEAGLPSGDKISGTAVQSIWLSQIGHQNGGNPVTTSLILIFFNSKVVANPSSLPTSNPTPQGNNYLSLSPIVNASATGSTTWKCLYKGSGIKNRWLPSTCRSTAIEWDGN